MRIRGDDMQRDERPAKADGKRENLPGLLGAMKRRHAGERSALRARQRIEARAMLRRIKAGR